MSALFSGKNKIFHICYLLNSLSYCCIQQITPVDLYNAYCLQPAGWKYEKNAEKAKFSYDKKFKVYFCAGHIGQKEQQEETKKKKK